MNFTIITASDKLLIDFKVTTLSINIIFTVRLLILRMVNNILRCNQHEVQKARKVLWHADYALFQRYDSVGRANLEHLQSYPFPLLFRSYSIC